MKEAWTRNTEGIYEGQKVLHHYSPSFPRHSVSEEADRHVVAGRAATLDKTFQCAAAAKAKSRIISLIIPSAKD